MPSVWGVDGYVNFYGMSEVWMYKTKFFAWYTKSFNEFYLPTAAFLEMSPGDVSGYLINNRFWR